MQLLAAEGIVLPASVIQRGIDSYMLHTDMGSVRIATPLAEMRVGDLLLRHAFPDGAVGPALRIRQLKGRPELERVSAIPDELAGWIVAHIDYMSDRGVPVKPQTPMLPIDLVTSTLTLMELKGMVRKVGPMRYLAVHENLADYEPSSSND